MRKRQGWLTAKRGFTAGLCCIIALGLLLPAAMAQTDTPTLPEGLLAHSVTFKLRLKNENTGSEVPFWVYLPRGYGNGERYPVWYGLHGSSSSENMWPLDAKIGDVADTLMESGQLRPMIMVFPLARYDTANVIQEDMKDGVRGESQAALFICNQLVPYIDANFNAVSQPDGRFIGGFSMGGLFALEIGLRHPELFSAIGAYSPALAQKDYSGQTIGKWLFPGEAQTEASAAFLTGHGLAGMRVYLDCGDDSDPFAEGIRSLIDVLARCGMNVTFLPHKGGHTLERDKLAEYLLFFGGVSTGAK